MNERIAAAEEELSDLVVTQATLARVFAERDAAEPDFEQVSSRDADPDDLPACLPPVMRVATGEVPAEGDWPVGPAGWRGCGQRRSAKWPRRPPTTGTSRRCGCG
ncbi:hypothetical protein [Streptomyces shenzhenensis]|uniref:hypothetical protein n=1 Tax=Streptomyces TaxID=1883 RepID=UPI001F284260|nr:hypothetical protein [Streptomyces shenzhenensis]